MALRSRTGLTTLPNQENVKNLKSSIAALPGKTKRAALGEIGNKVNSVRGVEPVDRTSLLQKDKAKKAVIQKPIFKPPVKVVEKPLVQIVKLIPKQTVHATNNESRKQNVIVVSPKKETDAFSSDLLPVEDIDEEDRENPVLVSIYSNDIYEYLRSLEKKYPVEESFLSGQEVTPKMRCVLIDWLVEVHQQFHLLAETLYLTVAIIDRFLQSYRKIDRKDLQLVGVTALFIASKYEEMYSPDISDFVYITDNAYSKTEILHMELLIVRTLDYAFGRPLPLHFLRRYSKAGRSIAIHHAMAKYLLELTLIHYDMCHYPPSLIAAAALYLAYLLLGNDDESDNKVIWTSTLVHYSTYTKQDILPVVRKIAALAVNAPKIKHQAIRKKYAHSKFMQVSARAELGSPFLTSLATGGREEV